MWQCADARFRGCIECHSRDDRVSALQSLSVRNYSVESKMPTSESPANPGMKSNNDSTGIARLPSRSFVVENVFEKLVR